MGTKDAKTVQFVAAFNIILKICVSVPCQAYILSKQFCLPYQHCPLHHVLRLGLIGLRSQRCQYEKLLQVCSELGTLSLIAAIAEIDDKKYKPADLCQNYLEFYVTNICAEVTTFRVLSFTIFLNFWCLPHYFPQIRCHLHPCLIYTQF